jgi:hypothetical protein
MPAKKKPKQPAKTKAKTAPKMLATAPAGNSQTNVPKNKVGATVQAMITFDGATHIDAVDDGAGTFTVTQIA